MASTGTNVLEKERIKQKKTKFRCVNYRSLASVGLGLRVEVIETFLPQTLHDGSGCKFDGLY
jgi:hypothetical protein